MFYPFIDEPAVKLTGIEPGGRSPAPGDHAASLSFGSKGVLHGSYSYVLQDEDGQTLDVHSVSAGLDYPGVGPEHSYWKDTGRVTYESIADLEALDAFKTMATLEGILPALESAHAIAHVLKTKDRRKPEDVLLICLSGRGDKDVQEVARVLGQEI
jgi:tryptophan synthase beta chain